MTTIAFRDGVVAADTGMTRAYGGRSGTTIKIVRNAAGDIAAAAGDAGYAAVFLRWFMAGEAGPPSLPDKEGGVGTIYRAGKPTTLTTFEPSGGFDIEAAYFAIGSGCCEALGAMFAGADAPTAVRAAIAHNNGTYGEVTVLRCAAAPNAAPQRSD